MDSESPKDQPQSSHPLQPYRTASSEEVSLPNEPLPEQGWSAEGKTTRFSSDIASPSERLASGVLDVIIVMVLGAFYTSTFGSEQRSTGFTMTFNDSTVNGFGVVFFQIVALGYFFLTELYLGASLGKLALGQRVVTVERTKPTPKQLAIRTVYRLVDGFPYFLPNLLGFLKLSNSDLRQRLGDCAANTIVIKTR